MKFLFNGLSLFGRKLVKDLAAFDSRHSYHFYDTYTSRLDQLKFICALPFADAVVSINGVSDPSGSLNAVLAMKKKLILHWQGTDVMLAMQRAGIIVGGEATADIIDNVVEGGGGVGLQIFGCGPMEISGNTFDLARIIQADGHGHLGRGDAAGLQARPERHPGPP